MNKRAIALGTFDGIHTGHRRIIDGVLKLSGEKGLEPMIYTFSNHPMEVFGKAPLRLMNDGERIARLKKYCPVLVEKFDAALAETDPEAFIRRLVNEQGMAYAVAGFNYTFGKHGVGNMDTLRMLGKSCGFGVMEVPPHMYGDEPVSSTRIRKCIECGDISRGNAMLGQEYAISGRIIANRGIGSCIGCPTANIPVPKGLVMPMTGVYAARAEVLGKTYHAITNIGKNPTVHGDHTTIETHLLDFEGSIYGEKLTVSFVERIRGEITFSSVGELAAQILKDKEKAAEIFVNSQRNFHSWKEAGFSLGNRYNLV